MTKPSLQHEIIKINIKSNGIRYIYADDEQHVDAGLEGGRVLSGLKLLQHHGHGISTWTTIRGNTPRFPGVACGWAAERARARHARTHARAHARARAHTRTVWASVNAAQRAHPRPRHAHTQSALHDTDRGNQRMATMKNQVVQAQVSRKNFSLQTFFSKSRTKINFTLFSERLLFLFPARILYTRLKICDRIS